MASIEKSSQSAKLASTRVGEMPEVVRRVLEACHVDDKWTFGLVSMALGSRQSWLAEMQTVSRIWRPEAFVAMHQQMHIILADDECAARALVHLASQSHAGELTKYAHIEMSEASRRLARPFEYFKQKAKKLPEGSPVPPILQMGYEEQLAQALALLPQLKGLDLDLYISEQAGFLPLHRSLESLSPTLSSLRLSGALPGSVARVANACPQLKKLFLSRTLCSDGRCLPITGLTFLEVLELRDLQGSTLEDVFEFLDTLLPSCASTLRVLDVYAIHGQEVEKLADYKFASLHTLRLTTFDPSLPRCMPMSSKPLRLILRCRIAPWISALAAYIDDLIARDGLQGFEYIYPYEERIECQAFFGIACVLEAKGIACYSEVARPNFTSVEQINSYFDEKDAEEAEFQGRMAAANAARAARGLTLEQEMMEDMEMPECTPQ